MRIQKCPWFKEKYQLIKEYKAELKFWKKELGEETRRNIKLEEKLNTIGNPSERSPPPLVEAPMDKKNSTKNIGDDTDTTKADDCLQCLCCQHCKLYS